MKNIKESLKKLTTIQKIEIVIASVTTVLLMIAVPVYAWFSNTNKVETMTKVKEPANLDICAGDGDSVENFELSNIDLEDIQKTGQPKCYVFGVVTGNLKTFYDIQIAHTTNIPFTYTLYRAEEATSSDANVVIYEPLDGSKTKYYKRSVEEGKTAPVALPLDDLNADTANISHYGRKLAKTDDRFYGLGYDDEDDDPEIYAVPIYSQVQELETYDADHDFYILEIGWDQTNSGSGFSKWNAAKNIKETDIIYITASRTTE